MAAQAVRPRQFVRFEIAKKVYFSYANPPSLFQYFHTEDMSRGIGRILGIIARFQQIKFVPEAQRYMHGNSFPSHSQEVEP
jgi:hypothetical protein